jgi:osmotically-inducible protein OsmY
MRRSKSPDTPIARHGAEPKGETIMAHDNALRSDIEAELDFEPSLDAASIGVAVKDGVATLTGSVSTYAEKIASEEAASRVRGVRAVADEITVKLAFDIQHDDAEIARRAANFLAWSVYLPADSVHVRVQQGWVTLTGDVDWYYHKQAAEGAVRRLSGVIGVTNLIKLRPQVATGDVRSRIAEAYRRNADLEASEISIAVDGGRVTLSGHVRAWGERRIAANAAWAIPSVTEVVDNLTIAL